MSLSVPKLRFSGRHGLLLLGFAVALFATGCVNRTIQIRTADVVVPTGRIFYQAVPPSESGRTGAGWSSISVDREISYSHGKDNQPHQMFEIYGQASIRLLVGGRGNHRGIRTEKYETGARLLPMEHFGIFAGYRWAQYNQWRQPDESDSDFDFDLRGPVCGLEFRL